MKLQTLGIIPARYASSRLPGKPLCRIGEKPLIQHVYENAHRALEELWVATDDERIADAVHAFGGRALLTSPHHPNGTARVAEAYRISGSSADVVVNVQGDEPFVDPSCFALLCSAFDDPTVQIATLVAPLSAADAHDPNTVKAVLSRSGQALYFSRAAVPYVRDADRGGPPPTYHQHIGLYAYRAEVLQELIRLETTPLEEAEKLEQLRWLEHGYKIQTLLTRHRTIGIDTEEDLLQARSYYHEAQPSDVKGEGV